MSNIVRTADGNVSRRYPSVAVTIVTYNSAKYISRCLDYVLGQDYPNLRIVVVDNASNDASLAELSPYRDRIALITNQRNNGFAAAQNQAIMAGGADWVLALNPDVRLLPDFVSKLVAAGDGHRRVGTVCGKLLTMRDDFAVPADPFFDSTGIFMTPNLRHFDRGSGLPDDGMFDAPEYVFGATGAAALYRKEMIEDISIGGEFFDADFFAYREDADVAWRAQLLGWSCLYEPWAVAYHVRRVLPSNRHSVAAVINMHSVKNRFLLRIKNTTAGLYRRFWLAITLRDCVVIAGCLLREWRSLPAFPTVLALLPRMLRKRRHIMSRLRASDGYLTRWFAFQPVGFPVSAPAAEETVVP